MPNIPNGSYAVTLSKTANSWANGNLVVSGPPSSQTVNYQVSGSPNSAVSSGWSIDAANVSFTVTGLVSTSGSSCTVAFTGGVYAVTPPPPPNGRRKITGGTATGDCLAASVMGTPSDSWSADGGPGPIPEELTAAAATKVAY